MKYIFLLTIICINSFTANAQDSKQAVNLVLDSLHQQAASAEFNAYFSLFSANATFIGTDVSEVWSIDQFKAYAKPHFMAGKGWTYLPISRNIYFSQDMNVAWFDEILNNKSLGVTRGTGVLVIENGQWKISQYHLTIPIPNAIADDVARQIKALPPKGQ